MKKKYSIIVLAVLIAFGTAACKDASPDDTTNTGGELTGTVTIRQEIYINDEIYADTRLGGSGTISYRWQTGPSDNGTFTNIPGATESLYTVKNTDVSVGSFLRVTVTRANNTGSVSSNAVQIKNISLTGAVTLQGVAAFGYSVIANTGNVGGSGIINYQWQTGTSASAPDVDFIDIDGATANRFDVRNGVPNVSEGRYLRVKISRTNFEGVLISKALRIEAAPSGAFMDFSNYSGPEVLTSPQPPEANQGAFTLGNGIAGSGLRINNWGEPRPVIIVTHGGSMASRVQEGDSAGYQYFFIDNPTLKAAQHITLDITFYVTGTGNFQAHYRRRGDGTANVFALSPNISRGNTQDIYVTRRITFTNCDFMADEQQHQGAQFRFPGNVPISRIELTEGSDSDLVPPIFPASTQLNNMEGKGVTGYQAWFRAGSGSWHHWNSSGGAPAPGNVNVELWPVGMEDYTANGVSLYDTDFIMPDGSRARLFNSRDRAVIRTHLKWMQEAGIDGLAPQRFYGDGLGGATFATDTGNAETHLTMIRDAAQEFGRIFYIMYDMTGTGSNRDQGQVPSRVKLDWIYNVEKKGLIDSPNYAQMEGKPVVCIWGLYADEGGGRNYMEVLHAIEVFQWFRDRGYYVIGGIPDDQFWQTNAHPRGQEMYKLLDMISPWYVGRDVIGQILNGGQWLNRGLEYTRSNTRPWADNKPIAFMPAIWPGFAWTNMNSNSGPPNHIPRNQGKWIWTQVQGYLNRDTHNQIKNFYLAMFDEYDEATNWMKGGVDYFDVPTGQYFKTHSADGYWLSSDYYMRMAKTTIQTLKDRQNGSNIGPLNDYTNSSSVIVEHSLGPVFWRNSFERRLGRLGWGAEEAAGQPNYFAVNHLQIDVGVPNGAANGQEISGTNVTVTGNFTVNRPRLLGPERSDNYNLPSTTLGMIYDNNAKSGGSVFRLAGTRTAGSEASYLYKIADTRIKANSNMSLSFWQKTENSLGENVTVDLKLDNGSYLSGLVGYSLQNTGTPQSNWQQKTVNLPAAADGRYITEVIVAYTDTGTETGDFAASIDDIIIQNR